MSEPVSAGLLGSLGINGKLFFGQLVNFVIILFIVWRWVYRPLLKIMDAREKKIRDGLRNADTAEKRMTEVGTQTQAMRRRAEQDAEQMMEDAKKQAEEKRKQIMEETRRELDRQLEEAKIRLVHEKKIVLDSARQEMAGLVMSAMEKIAPTFTSGDAGKALMNRAIKELERS